jgi:hypothetical protein
LARTRQARRARKGVRTIAATIQRDQASAAGESTPTASMLTIPLPAQMAMQEKGNRKARGIAISRKRGWVF